jgi:hypothetical protein
MAKIAEIRFLGTDQTIRVVVDARTIREAENILIKKLAENPNPRSATFNVVGSARKTDRDSLPTIDQLIAG